MHKVPTKVRFRKEMWSAATGLFDIVRLAQI
jgi:hypothetical protein